MVEVQVMRRTDIDGVDARIGHGFLVGAEARHSVKLRGESSGLCSIAAGKGEIDFR